MGRQTAAHAAAPASGPESLDLAGFRAWLRRRTKLGDRAVHDVVSRAKRAATFISLEGPADDNELTFLLRGNPEYLKCTGPVRSQIKRAALLYRTFAGKR